MIRYDILLLDADDTLLDYPRAARTAFAQTLGRLGLPFGDDIYDRYQAINQEYWRRFERGAVTQEVLQLERFAALFAELGLSADPATVNRDYLRALGERGDCLPGARELCARLSQSAALYIVTNGLSATQRGRLEHSGLLPYLKKLYISGEIGVQKPRREFFDHVLADIGVADRSRALMFGDSLTSDIQGGKNAGLATCWYAPHGGKPDAVSPDYIVRNYDEFLQIVLQPTPGSAKT